MGYRSDVVVLMYGVNNLPENNLMIKEFIRQRVPPDLMKYFDFDGWGVKFEAEQWKWYDSDRDIQILDKLFADYRETFCEGRYESEYAYEFIRVGEFYDDIDTFDAGATGRRLSVDRFIRVE